VRVRALALALAGGAAALALAAAVGLLVLGGGGGAPARSGGGPGPLADRAEGPASAGEATVAAPARVAPAEAPGGARGRGAAGAGDAPAATGAPAARAEPVLRGRVLVAPSGAAPEGARLLVRSAGAKDPVAHDVDLGPDGAFALALGPGAYAVVAEAAGARSAPARVTLPGAAEVDLRVQPPGAFAGASDVAVWGVVRDVRGDPVPGAVVEAGTTAGLVRAVADAHGRYALAGLPAGPVLLVGRSDGAGEAFVDVVYEGAPLERDLALEAPAAPEPTALDLR